MTMKEIPRQSPRRERNGMNKLKTAGMMRRVCALTAGLVALALAALLPAMAQQARPQDLAITDEDEQRFQDHHGLPPLERMGEAERAELVDARQVMRRMAVLGIEAESFQTPEADWKRLYNEVWQQVDGRAMQKARRERFEGDSVSALNRFIEGVGDDAVVEVRAAALSMDETLRVPTGIYVEGGGARLAPGGESLDRAVELDGCENCGVEGLVIEGGCDYGVYVKNVSGFVIAGNRISGTACKGIAVMGENSDFVIANNEICENGDGGAELSFAAVGRSGGNLTIVTGI